MFRPAGVFSATDRVAVSASKAGAEFSLTALSACSVRVLPVPCVSS